MRLTDEELSRALTAHEAGGLKRGYSQRSSAYPCCLFQAAFSISSFVDVDFSKDRWMNPGIDWFDKAYRSSWTTDEFLAALEARGLA